MLNKKSVFIVVIIFVVLITGAALNVFGESKAQLIEYLNSQDNRVLLRQGKELVRSDSLRPRAIACYQTVVERYRANPDNPTLTRDAIEAFRNLGNIHMTYMIDYDKAYFELSSAKRLADEAHNDYELAYILLSLSNLYNINSNGNVDLRSQSLEFQKDAYRLSVQSHNETVMAAVVVNMANFAFKGGDCVQYREIWSDVLSHQFYNDDIEAKMAKKLSEASLAYSDGDNKKAERLLNEALNIISGMSHVPFYERYYFSIKSCLYSLYDRAGEYEQAAVTAREACEHASRAQLLDYKMSFLGKLSLIYEKMNQQDSVDKYYGQYLKVQAELEDIHGYGSLESHVLKSRINAISKEKEKANMRRNMIVNTVIGGTSLVVVITVAGVVFFRRKRRRQNVSRRKGKDNMEMAYAYEMKEIAPDPDQPLDTHASDDRSDVYSGRLKRVYGDVVEYMDKSEEIYRQSYSLSDLSNSLEVPSRVVSQAIGTHRNCNFHQLLNEYRVHRVMDLMRNPEAKNVTIQSLSESAGFKSRTHFIAIFKKIAGETPSEFWNREHGEKGK